MIHFFGKEDRNKDGIVGSQVPGWAMESQLEELRRGIENKEARIARHLVPEDQVNYVREEVSREKKRMAEIETSRPNLTSEEKDRVFKAYKDISKDIKDSMFKYDDMMTGAASAREEARRMSEPIIKVDPDIAKACEVHMDTNGMVSRNDAQKIFKIVGAYLGEERNAEKLRRR